MKSSQLKRAGAKTDSNFLTDAGLACYKSPSKSSVLRDHIKDTLCIIKWVGYIYISLICNHNSYLLVYLLLNIRTVEITQNPSTMTYIYNIAVNCACQAGLIS